MRWRLNDRAVEADLPADTPLLYVLRNDFGLSGPKFGCGLGQCGACAVLVDGQPARACITPLEDVADKAVTTLEGLGTPERPHPLQTAFINHQAMQCGYCANGMIMTAAGLLEEMPELTRADLRTALSGALCRCGAHQRILDAVADAAAKMREAKDD